MVEWFKALNFLQSDRGCPRIESAKCSFNVYVHSYGQTVRLNSLQVKMLVEIIPSIFPVNTI